MEAFIGEVRMFTGNYAPQGWAFCNGQLLLIAENEALFTLIGTTYGGDGQTTFALPDYQGRVVVHQGTNATTGTPYTMGQKGGSETVTLTTGQLPAHTHQVGASSLIGSSTSPTNNVWSSTMEYSKENPDATMNQAIVNIAGAGQPHDNVMPYLTISYIIALCGVYPTQDSKEVLKYGAFFRRN